MNFIVEAQSTLEKWRMFLEVDYLEEIKKKLNKFCMVMILQAMHPDFGHV